MILGILVIKIILNLCSYGFQDTSKGCCKTGLNIMCLTRAPSTSTIPFTELRGIVRNTVTVTGILELLLCGIALD